jgi:hypothetical protein
VGKDDLIDIRDYTNLALVTPGSMNWLLFLLQNNCNAIKFPLNAISNLLCMDTLVCKQNWFCSDHFYTLNNCQQTFFPFSMTGKHKSNKNSQKNLDGSTDKYHLSYLLRFEVLKVTRYVQLHSFSLIC